MNLSIVNGGQVKAELYGGNVDFDAHTFRAILVRSGFNFNATSYKYLANLKATSTVTATVSAAARTITRTGGTSFLATGYVAGNLVNVVYDDDATPTPNSIDNVSRITSVTADLMRLTHVSGDVLTDAVGNSVDITSNDELPNGTDDPNGYVDSDNTNPVGGPAVTFTIDGDVLTLNPFDLSVFAVEPLIDFSPGMIIYDDTHASNLIICYATFDPWTLQF